MPAVQLWLFLSERKDVSLHARIKKLDLERPICDGLRLSDELVEPLLGDRSVALLVDLGAVSVARRASVEENTKAYRCSTRSRAHHKMHIARVEAVGDPPV